MTNIDDSRKEFEAEMKNWAICSPVTFIIGGYTENKVPVYDNSFTQHAWLGWQACEARLLANQTQTNEPVGIVVNKPESYNEPFVDFGDNKDAPADGTKLYAHHIEKETKPNNVHSGEEVSEALLVAMAALKQIKLRLHFMGWPAESYWNNGTDEKPHWIPDWRYEIALLENALHGADITQPAKPTDTKRANEITAPQQAIPAEPTKEMMHAFYSKPVPQYSFTEAYKAMLSAAPTSPIDNGVRTCDWEGGYDDSMPSTYKGTCGIVWSFIEDGLAENDCKFCPRCGGKITDITVHLESDE
jgi:hypothetical protein